MNGPPTTDPYPLDASPPTVSISLLATTMGAATFSLVVVGVLASELIETFSVSRGQIGFLVTATGLIGAICSPVIGPLADRYGARRATLVTLVVAAGSLTAVALAPGFGFLLVAAGLTGLAQAGGNPATNKLIAERVPTGRRGMVTGLKQSGVQIGVFLGGIALPPLAVLFGWRSAVLVFAVIPAVAAVVAWITLDDDPPPTTLGIDTARVTWRPNRSIMRLAGYGMLLGAGGSAITTYLALFAQESLGVGVAAAGRAVALVGVLGIIGRISWGRISERRLGPGRSLEFIALIAAGTAMLLAAAPRLGIISLWLAAIGVGVSAVSWNAVGMLAIIVDVAPAETGRASGVVLAGFLSGVAFGAPLLGRSVDLLGTYTPGWLGTAVVFLIAWSLIRGKLRKEV